MRLEIKVRGKSRVPTSKVETPYAMAELLESRRDKIKQHKHQVKEYFQSIHSGAQLTEMKRVCSDMRGRIAVT